MSPAPHWVRACALEDIPRLGSRVIERPGGNIALFRNNYGVYALRDLCPHRGGPLSPGFVHGDTVTCPLHGWKIQLATGAACSPDEGTTPCFAVKIENDEVFVDLPA